MGPRAGVEGCGKCRPHRDFFLLLYLYCFVLALSFVLCPFLYNTNIHAPGGIRTRNPSNRSAADPRLRPLDHWDRLGFYSRTIQPVANRVPTELSLPTTVLQFCCNIFCKDILQENCLILLMLVPDGGFMEKAKNVAHFGYEDVRLKQL